MEHFQSKVGDMILTALTRPFVRLMATSPEIESQPFIRRPRTMAAAWGGFLLCKLGAMVVVSPSVGLQLFALVLATGVAATYLRFGSEPRELLNQLPTQLRIS